MVNKRFCKKAFLGAVMILSFNILFSQKMINYSELITCLESDDFSSDHFSGSNNKSLEKTLSLEGWMIKPFQWTDSSFLSETGNSLNEPEIQFEEWMLDPEYFIDKREKFEEENLLYEAWMFTPEEFQIE